MNKSRNQLTAQESQSPQTKRHRAATSLRSCIRVFCSSAPLKACRRASTIFSKPSWQVAMGKNLGKATMAPWLFETGKTTKNDGAMASIWLPYHISMLVYCRVQKTGKTTWDWTKQTRGSGWRLMDVETPISSKDNGKVVGIDFIQETSMACWIIPQNGWLSYNNGVFPLRKWCGMVLSSLDLCFALPRQRGASFMEYSILGNSQCAKPNDKWDNHGTILGWLGAQL